MKTSNKIKQRTVTLKSGTRSYTKTPGNTQWKLSGWSGSQPRSRKK